jgi:hypothetical protein
MKKISKTNKKKKDWFRVKKYPHIGLPINGKSRMWIQEYVSNPIEIARHSFLPFIHKVSKVRRFRREICHDGTRSSLRKPTEKRRELFYSAHLDSNIFGYYAELISNKYEEKLKTFGISECVTAYRRIALDPLKIKSRNKCNVDFANDVFTYIKESTENKLVAITFDIKSFYDTPDHKLLKRMWRRVMEFELDLPPNHYNVFRNITAFSYVDERELFNCFKDQILVARQPSIIKTKKIVERKFLRDEGAIAFCLQNKIEEIRAKNYIKSNKYEVDDKGNWKQRKRGIPQGAPISSVLANIYMLDFDLKAKEFVGDNGIYRRYSDDMVVVCPLEKENDVLDFFAATITQFELEIQPAKTQVFHFIRDQKANQFNCFQKNLNTGKLQSNTKFEYLGFQFDGFNTLLKSSSLSNYYRKMKRSIRRGKYYSIFNKTKTKGELFKNRLYKRFTHLGAHRRRIYHRNRHDPSQFIVTEKYDWGNYLSYAYLASNIIPDNKIRRQVRNHWRKFHSLLKS